MPVGMNDKKFGGVESPPVVVPTPSGKAFFDMIKELIRLALFAAISGGVVYGTKRLGGLDPSSYWVIVGTTVLNSIDTFIHKNPNINANGLIGF